MKEGHTFELSSNTFTLVASKLLPWSADFTAGREKERIKRGEREKKERRKREERKKNREEKRNRRNRRERKRRERTKRRNKSILCVTGCGLHAGR